MKNKMKKIIFPFLVCFAFFFCSCYEDKRTQFPVDVIPPDVVTNISVTNFNGYSEISYEIPYDEDLLHIECQYVNSRNEESMVKASAFTNKLTVSGFLRSATVSVELFSVDKSGNRSQPVSVDIEPMDSPILDILETVEIISTFGGAGILWNNEEEIDIVMEVLVKDEESSQFVLYENIYSADPQVEKRIRGLELIEQEIGVVIRNQYQQRTDTTVATITPLEEQLLDSDLFVELPHKIEFNVITLHTDFASLWNGDTYYDNYSIYGDKANPDGSVWFTFDLGKIVRLSRFKMWVRWDHYYVQDHPKHIELYGTNDADMANNPDSFAGWVKLGEWNDKKPSGNDGTVAITVADVEAAIDGIDFDIPLTVDEPFRYIRWKTLEAWGGTNRMSLSELKFWGEK